MTVGIKPGREETMDTISVDPGIMLAGLPAEAFRSTQLDHEGAGEIPEACGTRFNCRDKNTPLNMRTTGH